MQESGRIAGETVSFVDILVILLRHYKLIVGITIFSGIISVGLMYLSIKMPPQKSFLPNVYTAEATLLLDAETTSAITNAANMSSLANLGSLLGGAKAAAGPSPDSLITAISKSKTTLDELIQATNIHEGVDLTPKLRQSFRRRLSSSLALSYETSSGMLKVKYTDINPEFAMFVANTTIQILKKRMLDVSEQRSSTKRLELEEKLVEVKINIDDLQKQLEDFIVKNGTISIETIGSEQLTVIGRLRADLIMKDIEISGYRRISTVEDSTLRRMLIEREELNKAIKELETGTSSIIPDFTTLSKLATENSSLKRDLMIQTEIYKTLIQQNEAIKLSEYGDKNFFYVLEYADKPIEKSGPGRSKYCVYATGGAFIFAVILAFLIELTKKLLSNKALIERLRGHK